MGKKTTDSTSSQQSTQTGQLGPEDPRYTELREGLSSFLTGALSDNADDPYSLSPEILEQLRTIQREETRRGQVAIDASVDEQYSRLEGYLAKKGQTDTSMERTGASLLERDISRQREDVTSRTGQQFSESAVQAMLNQGNTLSGLKYTAISDLAAALLSGYGQEGLAGRTITSSGSGTGQEIMEGFSIGELAGLLPPVRTG